MANMFYGASSFDQNINTWNTGTVATMANMFRNATQFNQVLKDWTISNVTTMQYMFSGSGMTYCSFDQTVNGWAVQPVQTNVTLTAREYSDASSAARTTLTTGSGWTITGSNRGANPLTITPSTLITRCLGGSVTLTATNTSITSVSWNTGETTLSINPVINATGANVFTITDECGSSRSATVTLPSSGNLATNGQSMTCNVTGSAPVHFFATDGNYIGAIDPKGGTGNLTLTAYVNGAPGSMFACDKPSNPTYETAYMQRTLVVNDNVAITGNLSNPELYFPFNATELSDLRTKSLATTGNTVDDISTIADLVATKYDGTNENNTPLDNCGTGTSVVVPQNGNGSVSSLISGISGDYVRFAVSNFSEFSLHGQNNNSPLPITLTRFSVNCNDGLTNLLWVTATESNVSHFEIYNSTDGNEWTLVKSVDAVGNSSTKNEYTISVAPRTNENYYRLVSVDNDGTTQTFSPISSICNNSNDSRTWNAFPIPTNDRLTVQINSLENYTTTFTLTDLSGKIVEVIPVTLLSGQNNIILDSKKWNEGSYLLLLNEYKPLKIVKVD